VAGSTPYPNVLYEFGTARGLDKPVALCQQRSMPALSANIVSDQLPLLYSRR
jgi:hypothetical protein